MGLQASSEGSWWRSEHRFKQVVRSSWVGCTHNSHIYILGQFVISNLNWQKSRQRKPWLMHRENAQTPQEKLKRQKQAGAIIRLITGEQGNLPSDVLIGAHYSYYEDFFWDHQRTSSHHKDFRSRSWTLLMCLGYQIFSSSQTSFFLQKINDTCSFPNFFRLNTAPHNAGKWVFSRSQKIHYCQKQCEDDEDPLPNINGRNQVWVSSLWNVLFPLKSHI